MVKEDKSLNGFIRAGHRELIPLAEFRKWLLDIRNQEQFREKKRRDETVYRLKSGEIGYGPFTWEARQMILERLLKLRCEVTYGTERETYMYSYSADGKKYVTSLFNFIFIPDGVNCELGNRPIGEKLEVLDNYKDKISCDDSKMVISKVRKNFKEENLAATMTEKDVKDRLDRY